MDFLERAKKALENDETNEQWVYNRSEKRLIELNLGSGIRLEVTYYTTDDLGLDNIEKAILIEHGTETLLDEDDLQLLSELSII